MINSDICKARIVAYCKEQQKYYIELLIEMDCQDLLENLLDPRKWKRTSKTKINAGYLSDERVGILRTFELLDSEGCFMAEIITNEDDSEILEIYVEDQ